jgi:ornithine--oxo-acid transaminase
MKTKYPKDVDGKEYLDFAAMFSAVNTGHCNPCIMEAVMEQMGKGSVSSYYLVSVSGDT